MKRLISLIALLVLLAIVFVGCGGNESGNTPTDTGQTGQNGTVVEEPTVEGRTFTLAELAEFDGKDGKPAYVAVDGVVYDVTGSANWPEGDHTPCNLDAMAGKDLSQVLAQAPARMRGYIEAKPVVGTLQE